MNKSVIRQHLKWAEEAGIDVLIVTWWGEKKVARRSSDVTFQKLLEEVKAFRSPIKLCPYYEIVPEGNPQAAVKDLLHILKDYASHPQYFRAEGKPVIFIYERVILQLNAKQWKKVIEEVKAKEQVILVADQGPEEIVRLFDSIHMYNTILDGTYGGYNALLNRCKTKYCQKTGLIPTITVVPGWNASHMGKKNYVDVNRENGEVYHRTWGYALKSGAPWVLITSFNEWYEGTEIEPSKELGRAYLEITAEYANALKRLPLKEQRKLYPSVKASGELVEKSETIICPKVVRGLKINGTLKDYRWQRASAHNKFYQFDGNPACSETSIYLMYDEDFFYIGFSCKEPGIEELSVMAKDSSSIWSWDDCVEIFIAPGNRTEKVYQFITNSAGTKKSSCRKIPWKGKWEVATAVHKKEKRWTVEVSIPFSSLGKRPGKGDVWWMNFFRDKALKSKWPQEISSAFPSFGDAFVPYRFGKIKFE